MAKQQDPEIDEVMQEMPDEMNEANDADTDCIETEPIDAKAQDMTDEDSFVEEESPDENADKKSEKRNLFKKRDKKSKQDEQIADLTDRLKRQMAEFDNFRKRTEKEKAQMYEIGAKSVIEKILPVVDNFERALGASTESGADSAFMEGMDMIYKQLMTELEGIGVKPIEAVGVEFNPDFHNAVMQVESEEFESGIVAAQLQKGYMYRETVVRHSMVSVVE